MRILFIGCVESSYRLLKKLIEEKVTVAGVITKEASGFHADFCDLRPLCVEHGIPCFYAHNVNDLDSMEFIRSLAPDAGFCFGWSQLLKQELLDLFPQGVVGFHPAALPHNRGRHPVIWALALGLEETASAFFMINAGADEGDIISLRPVSICYEDDARMLYDKIMDAALQQEMEIVAGMEQGTLRRIPQRASEGNTWRKRGKKDGEIDWRMSGRNIYNLVRSLARPYPGAHFVFGGTEYKVWKVQETDTAGFENLEPGKVLAVNPDGTMDVKAGSGGIRLVEFDAVAVKEGDYLL